MTTNKEDAVSEDREKKENLCDRMAEVFKEYAMWFGGVHVGDCPEDDTCDCEGKVINDRVNSVVSEYDRLHKHGDRHTPGDEAMSNDKTTGGRELARVEVGHNLLHIKIGDKILEASDSEKTLNKRVKIINTAHRDKCMPLVEALEGLIETAESYLAQTYDRHNVTGKKIDSARKALEEFNGK